MRPCTHGQRGTRSRTPFSECFLFFSYRLLSANSRVESMPISQALRFRPRMCSTAYLEGLRDDPPEIRWVGVSLHGMGFPGASLEHGVGRNRCSGTCTVRRVGVPRLQRVYRVEDEHLDSMGRSFMVIMNISGWRYTAGF